MIELTQRVCTQTQRNIAALFYSFTSTAPFYVGIPTASYRKIGFGARHIQLPLVEVALGTRLFIHDCLVELVTSGDSHAFRVFFTRHAYQPKNPSVARIFPDGNWHGQILVMKIGKREETSVINLRSGDRALARVAVLK
ncbi:hypothetical protein Hypma_016609 [Hypsizygus marmoreus]|uniref:Uncharacterized protein n=1 Tax=Hypsizygus marmoreus TaxID=39966 RepID=A0A369J483_HYPMA|nr:hypothetical protein Hypma_016609 [Hypsizygus marmoreus]